MFNLWIYQRRPACSARMQHGGSGSIQPMDETVLEPVEQSEARAVVNSAQSPAVESKVLPFRSPPEGAPRESVARSERSKPRGRSKGRAKG